VRAVARVGACVRLQGACVRLQGACVRLQGACVGLQGARCSCQLPLEAAHHTHLHHGGKQMRWPPATACTRAPSGTPGGHGARGREGHGAIPSCIDGRPHTFKQVKDAVSRQSCTERTARQSTCQPVPGHTLLRCRGTLAVGRAGGWGTTPTWVKSNLSSLAPCIGSLDNRL